MTNVHDIIRRICEGHQIIPRHLAMMAGIPPTTLESALRRRPNQARKSMLRSIARVFGKPWYALMTSSDDPDQVPTGKSENFIPCDEIDDDDADRIVAHFLASPLPEFTPPRQSFKMVGGRESQATVHTVSEDEHLRQAILFMLRKLNSDGLMDVMAHTLAATKNTEFTRKEDF